MVREGDSNLGRSDYESAPLTKGKNHSTCNGSCCLSFTKKVVLVTCQAHLGRFVGNFRERFTQDSFNSKRLTCDFFQVKNLPIKSPKVPTLKKALKRFHQTQKGKSSKPLATKLLEEASLKEDTGNKEGKLCHVFHSRFLVVISEMGV